jgi:Rad3-related DNA helicase
LNHPYQILNYSYFLYEGNYVGKFSDYPIVICDEADSLESTITSFIKLDISQAKLRDLEIDLPEYKTPTAAKGLDSWKRWADETKNKVTRHAQAIYNEITRLSPNKQLTPGVEMISRNYNSFKTLEAKLKIFSRYVDESWIFQEQKNSGVVTGWSFQPTWLIPTLAENYFWKHAGRFVLMSATLPPKLILTQMLGLSIEDLEYIEISSMFPTENRPVYLNPVADMAYKTFEDNLPALLTEIERIVNSYPNSKGIIHTTSYKLNQCVMNLKNSRLISHNSSNKDEVLKLFTASQNAVLVSPSSTRGVDLPDDQCRFIIIAKAPFQSLGDKLVSSRVYGAGGLGKFWYRAMCAQNIVQASGRGVRHKNDHCVTYVLDKQAEKLIVDNQKLFPRYWMEAVDYL